MGVVAVLIVALTVTQGGAALAGSNGPARAVSVAAGPVATVDFQGVPGQLTIVGSSGSQVQLTGHLDWHSHTAAATENARTGGNVLHLTARCARWSPCTENYRLTVPAHTSVILDQPSGHVTVSGLDSALRVTATSADISATGLRSPTLDATITSTHLSASFTGPARQIGLTLKSAQATIRLPGAARYLVSQQVTWGYIKVGVPPVGQLIPPHRGPPDLQRAGAAALSPRGLDRRVAPVRTGAGRPRRPGPGRIPVAGAGAPAGRVCCC
jgi:hypothetical protein